MRSRLYTAGVALAALAGIYAFPAATQNTAAPTRYTMDAGTISGFGAMAQGGGIGAMANALRGGGGAAMHELVLRLGSSQAPSGPPAAQHFMPENAKLGVSVPLVTPTQGKPENYSEQMPSGRLLLFWGCGEHAGAGQPVVIDFAKLAKGQVPPGLYANALSAAEDWQVNAANSRTYGDWPNAKDTKTLSPKSSLLGAHRIAGNYSPEIAFTLDTDFMDPVSLRSSRLPSTAWGMTWGPVRGATGYYAWAIGAKDGKSTDMVWWASSKQQAFGGPMAGYLSPGSAAKLVAAGTLMPPSQTNCTVPVEVAKAGGDALMMQFFAYGPQRDFSHPARPANAKAGWQPDWVARARFRSSTMAMLGMDMSGMDAMGDMAESDDAPAEPALPKCKGLAGIAKRAAGLCR